mgnify:CR=1 FL=1
MTAVALVHFAHVAAISWCSRWGLAAGSIPPTSSLRPRLRQSCRLRSITRTCSAIRLRDCPREGGHCERGFNRGVVAAGAFRHGVVEDAARRAGDKLVVPDFSLLSVGKVTRGAALLTCGTALEHEGRAPRAVPQRSEDCLSTEYTPHAQPTARIQPTLR